MTLRRSLAFATVVGLALASGTAFAGDGDAAKGEKNFRRCAVCHSVKPDKVKIGPSLAGVVGREAGSSASYASRYSADMKAAGAKGLKWDEEKLTAYLKDPAKYIGGVLGKGKAKLRMRNKFPKESFRKDVAAYLATVK